MVRAMNMSQAKMNSRYEISEHYLRIERPSDRYEGYLARLGFWTTRRSFKMLIQMAEWKQAVDRLLDRPEEIVKMTPADDRTGDSGEQNGNLYHWRGKNGSGMYFKRKYSQGCGLRVFQNRPSNFCPSSDHIRVSGSKQ